MENKMGAGDLRMEDVLKMDKSKAMNLFRNRFMRYKNMVEEIGEEAAYEKMLEKYPEQQKALMGAFIDNDTIANGFKKAVALLAPMGFITEVIDVSKDGRDAAIEIQKVCPALPLAKEYGFDTPCHILCEMEQEAARRAFPGMKASIVTKQSEGACACIFQYERPAQNKIYSAKRPSILSQVLDIIGLIPTLLGVALKLLKSAILRQISDK
ncbi:MAG: L-2-amino-thiazoline-4-carboxylic acid hydrolase [Scytonematopsis contorta HA4267-MV1]|jgi:predicted ArsR family transcriptional regulator|nr:L-2-amino-thiazoline-4-carboxylic acid hydrolase [Scytonematopsis contorta HA4267-MV1]